MSALRGAWESMAAELDGDTEAVRRFFTTYLALLGARVDAVSRALDRREEQRARTVLLTLRCTSVMVGAEDVGAAADRLLALPIATSAEDVPQALGALRVAATTSGFQVAELLAAAPGPAAPQAGGSNR
ncbi:hypothetical protein ACFVTZ_00835 [Cellulosimicrobium cellulans]|uniref:hypothetical protein n=1 Tax=Cellulosimicrobium cellulans TaxID=1710 RepID=UPI0036E88430